MSTDLNVFSKLYLRLGVAHLGEVLFSHEKNVILKTLFRVIYTKQKKNQAKAEQSEGKQNCKACMNFKQSQATLVTEQDFKLLTSTNK